MSEAWNDIASAPKDGTTIRVKRVYEGHAFDERLAAWRTVTFPAFTHYGAHEPEYTATGWMHVDCDKRVPQPTHWLPVPLHD